MNIAKLREVIRYGIVGVLNTFSYYISVYFLYIKLNYNEYIAIFISYVIALSIAIILNLLFTFKRYKKSAYVIYKYIKVVFVVFLANCTFTKVCFILIGSGVFSNDNFIAGDRFIEIQILFSILFFILNYILIKRKVFNEST